MSNKVFLTFIIQMSMSIVTLSSLKIHNILLCILKYCTGLLTFLPQIKILNIWRHLDLEDTSQYNRYNTGITLNITYNDFKDLVCMHNNRNMKMKQRAVLSPTIGLKVYNCQSYFIWKKSSTECSPLYRGLKNMDQNSIRNPGPHLPLISKPCILCKARVV